MSDLRDGIEFIGRAHRHHGLGRQLRGLHRCAHQQGQGVQVQLHLTLALCTGNARRFDQGLARAQFQLVEHAVVVLELEQLERRLTRAQGLLGQGQLPLIGPQRVVARCDGAHQADLRGFARLFGGQQLSSSRFGQSLHAPKQIDLE